MGRSLTEIRAEIETCVRERALIYRQQADGVTELNEIRGALDSHIRFLWEELREARVGIVALSDFSPTDVRRLIRYNPRVVLA